MEVMMRKIVLIILVLVFIFIACDKKAESPFSPEIKPRATLTIAMQYEPVIFSYNWIFDSWCCSNCIIITETNGVGGYIDGAKLEFISGGQAYESKSYEGKSFNAGESWTSCDAYCTIYEYEKIRITITGKDANDYAINVSKSFDISYI
jgi:hypothetical protein